jgi:hypothetical protein
VHGWPRTGDRGTPQIKATVSRPVAAALDKRDKKAVSPDAPDAKNSADQSSRDEVSVLVHEGREDVLVQLLDDPRFDQQHLCLMLSRKELSTAFLEQVASQERWLRNYAVRRALAFHPHLSQTVGLRLVRELYVTDLVQLTLAPSGAPALKHFAEELVLARLPQLPPAQKMILARRGTTRIAGALLADGQPEVVATVLESPFLNEGQVLRVLSRINVPARVITAIASNGRWTQHYSVRLALVRNPQTPLATVLSFLPSIATPDLQILAQSSSVPSNVRPHLRRELANRAQRGAEPAKMGRLRPK